MGCLVYSSRLGSTVAVECSISPEPSRRKHIKRVPFDVRKEMADKLENMLRIRVTKPS